MDADALVRRYWPARLGTPLAKTRSGVNADRMWSCPEGVAGRAAAQRD